MLDDDLHLARIETHALGEVTSLVREVRRIRGAGPNGDDATARVELLDRDAGVVERAQRTEHLEVGIGDRGLAGDQVALIGLHRQVHTPRTNQIQEAPKAGVLLRPIRSNRLTRDQIVAVLVSVAGLMRRHALPDLRAVRRVNRQAGRLGADHLVDPLAARELPGTLGVWPTHLLGELIHRHLRRSRVTSPSQDQGNFDHVRGPNRHGHPSFRFCSILPQGFDL